MESNFEEQLEKKNSNDESMNQKRETLSWDEIRQECEQEYEQQALMQSTDVVRQEYEYQSMISELIMDCTYFVPLEETDSKNDTQRNKIFTVHDVSDLSGTILSKDQQQLLSPRLQMTIPRLD